MADNSTTITPSRRNHPDKRVRRCPAKGNAKQTGRDNDQVKACKDKLTIDKRTKRKVVKQKYEKAKQIIACKQNNPELTQKYIAQITDSSESHVCEVLKLYGLNKQSIDDFNIHKVDIFNGIQARLLSKISEEDIQKASMLQKVTASGILQDKIGDLSGTAKVQPMVIINRISVAGQVEDRPIDVTPDQA